MGWRGEEEKGGERKGRTHVADVLVPDGTEEGDAIAEEALVLVPHLVELYDLGAVSA